MPESTALLDDFAAPIFHRDGEETHLNSHGSSGEMAPTAGPKRRSQWLAPAQKASSWAQHAQTGAGQQELPGAKPEVAREIR